MPVTAVLPVKRFATAKQRLRLAIDSEEALRNLLEAMLADVLEAIGAARMIERTIVVSGEETAQELAAAAGAELITDPDDAGHSEAALLGIAAAERHGASAVALLPGDCPLLDHRDLDGLLTAVPAGSATIVPDRHGTGTNALVISPPGALRPAFGEGSRERHIELARAAAIAYSVDEVPSLALDLDTPGDLIALTSALEGDGQARRTAKALGI